MELEIIYQDDFLVAVNKPHGLLVHRSKIANDAEHFALQCLRNQLNRRVYPCHRLDRKTSGVLLFALDEQTHQKTSELFREKSIVKTYWSIVRGFTPDHDTIDYALKSEKGNIQEAVTHYKMLQQFEIPLPFGKHNTSRYSFVEVTPETGRMHQIRKHLAHILHPIIGDRPHGCNKQNKLWKETYQMISMMLHAKQLVFFHPISEKQLIIEASISAEFERVLSILQSESVLS